MPVLKIGIIGGGPGGVSLCMQLKNALPQALYRHIEIIVFEKNSRLGFGFPYLNEEACYRINLKKAIMEPIPGETHRFSNWVDSTQALKDTDFPPRHYFGSYLESGARHLQQEAASLGLNITFLTEHDVVDIKPLEHGLFAAHAYHKQAPSIHRLHQVILCIGHLPTSNFIHFIDTPGYQHNPWDSHAYNTLKHNDVICILGSKLTAIDVALKLQAMKHQGPIYMVSRSGLLPTIKGETSSYRLHYLISENFRKIVANDALPVKLETIISLLEQELTHCIGKSFTIDTFIEHVAAYAPLHRITQEINKIESGFTEWQKVLSVFYQYISRIWPLLSLEDQCLFHKRYHHTFMTYLCSLPLESAYKIQAMLKHEQLHVLPSVLTIDYESPRFSIRFKSRTPIFADKVINATGSGNDLTEVPLLKNMLYRGLISEHKIGGIRVNPSTLRVIEQSNDINLNLYAMGDLVKGACFTMVEVGRVTEQAKTIVQQLLQNMLCKRDNLWVV